MRDLVAERVGRRRGAAPSEPDVAPVGEGAGAYAVVQRVRGGPLMQAHGRRVAAEALLVESARALWQRRASGGQRPGRGREVRGTGLLFGFGDALALRFLLG